MGRDDSRFRKHRMKGGIQLLGRCKIVSKVRKKAPSWRKRKTGQRKLLFQIGGEASARLRKIGNLATEDGAELSSLQLVAEGVYLVKNGTGGCPNCLFGARAVTRCEIESRAHSRYSFRAAACSFE